ncbi:MAG: TAXI family TRAP transporter solute-binding subunit [bacterium]|nr:TAXI family TRAP transporter solute-binding subunit [bacterium]
MILRRKVKLKKSLVILILIVNGICCSGQNEDRLIMATATTGGTYYPVGVAISTTITQHLQESHNISMAAISSAGSGENIQMILNREADLAILQGLYGAMAWSGKGVYKDNPIKDILSITMLWENVEHFVIKSDLSKNGNIDDMKSVTGRNFSIGSRGSGTEVSGREILSKLGFDPQNDFNLQYLGYTPSANAFQDGRIVGMNIPAGPPASAITQVYASAGAEKVRILEFTDDQIATINNEFDVWKRYTLPENTYPGQNEKIDTIAQSNFLAVHRSLDENVVYELLKCLYNNLDELKRIHKAVKELDLNKAVTGLTVPLHPGAVKFYREKGVNIPESLIIEIQN